MTRFEEVKHVVAQGMAKAVTSEIPVSSVKGCEIIAQAVCEWMHDLHPMFLSDDEIRAFVEGTETTP